MSMSVSCLHFSGPAAFVHRSALFVWLAALEGNDLGFRVYNAKFGA